MRELVTVGEVARETGVTQNTVRKAIRNKRLPAEQFGDIWLVRRDDIARYRQEAVVGRPKKDREAYSPPACPRGEAPQEVRTGG